jgi:nucleotide-binding universal stress UspA family protein
MGFRDILVAIDLAPAARARVEIATALAERFDAHLVGLYTPISASAPETRGYFDYFNRSAEPFHKEFEKKLQAEANAMRLLFEQITARHVVSAEWRQASGYPSDAVSLHGRYLDLIVLGQRDPDNARAPLLQPSPGEVALAIGRPMLVVPYAGNWTKIGMHILVAWDGSRPATRAVNDALPFLVVAEAVTVVVVDAEQEHWRHGDVPGADIALHLSRHGVNATVQSIPSAGIGVGNALLSRACDLGADLLVMGAYGHLRERELVFGGVTRTILGTMTVPVLMAH